MNRGTRIVPMPVEAGASSCPEHGDILAEGQCRTCDARDEFAGAAFESGNWATKLTRAVLELHDAAAAAKNAEIRQFADDDEGDE